MPRTLGFLQAVNTASSGLSLTSVTRGLLYLFLIAMPCSPLINLGIRVRPPAVATPISPTP
jgi:hypothetical protein